MRREIAKKLKKKARDVAKLYSSPERAKNTYKDFFEVDEIRALSDFTAAVIFKKSVSKKKAVAFFYWVNLNEGYWTYFLPTDSHILGMDVFKEIKAEIERYNYDKN